MGRVHLAEKTGGAVRSFAPILTCPVTPSVTAQNWDTGREKTGAALREIRSGHRYLNVRNEADDH